MSGLTGLFVALDGADGTTPVGARKALAGLLQWSGSGTPFDVQTGVFPTDGTAVVAGTSGMSYDVSAFVAVLLPSAAIGPVIAANDAPVNVATTAAPGSNSRIDVIWCRQHLVAADGGADSDVDLEIGVTQGTPAASPSVPSIPTGALGLYKVTVPTGTTATNVLTFTKLHGDAGTNAAYRPAHVVKAGDQTYNTNALADDTGLQFPGAANAVYQVESVVHYVTSGTTSGPSVSLSLPSGTFDAAVTSGRGGTGDNTIVGVAPAGSVTDTLVVLNPLGGGTEFVARATFRVAVGVTGGTVKFRFVDAAGGETLTVKSGSWLTAQRVA